MCDTAVLQILIDKGANLNAQNNDGETVIFGCVYPTRTEMLLKAGACVKIVNKNGESALHYAARRNDLATILLLIQYGADLNLTDNNGIKARDVCTYFYVKDFIKYILLHYYWVLLFLLSKSEPEM